MRPKDDFMRKNVSIAAFKHSTISLTEKTRLTNHKAPEDTTPMLSPCVARCGLNDEDYCMGCFRHIDEIVSWRTSSEAQQAAICQQLPARKALFEGSENQHILSRDKWLAAEARLTDKD